MNTPRTFEDFFWCKLKFVNSMVGFGWSSDWATTQPWTMNGIERPYVGWVQEGKHETAQSRFVWYALYLGPILLHFARTT